MLHLEIIERKKKIEKNGELIFDLVEQSWRPENAEIKIQQFIVVQDEWAMRPDLVSHAAYGTDRFTDYLLKFNGISNPFSIEAGDILVIPEIIDMQKNLLGDRTQRTDLRESQLDPSKISTKDKKRLEFLEKKAQNKGLQQSKSPLPPNFAPIGTQEITIEGGIIKFGNANTISTECGDSLSKARFKQKMLQKRLRSKSSAVSNNQSNQNLNTGING